MKIQFQNRDLVLQKYGAAELKMYSQKATYKAFGITMTLILLLFLIFSLLKTQPVLTEDTEYYSGTIELTKYKTQKSDYVIKMSYPKENTIPASGTQKVEGNYVPSQNEETAISSDNIATTKESGQMSSTLGEGKNFNETLPQSTNEGSPASDNQAAQSSIYEDKEFVFVDSEPVADLSLLQKSVVYPEFARKARIEGRVVVRVLIGLNGEVLKSKIDLSENSIFEDAALNAIMTPGLFKPAIQNNKPVLCWISIPIVFRLR